MKYQAGKTILNNHVFNLQPDLHNFACLFWSDSIYSSEIK